MNVNNEERFVVATALTGMIVAFVAMVLLLTFALSANWCSALFGFFFGSGATATILIAAIHTLFGFGSGKGRS